MPNEQTPNEENMTITQTAPDGTETVIEVTGTKPDDSAADGDKGIVEEVYEALFDDTDADDAAPAPDPTDNDATDTAAGDPAMYEMTPTAEEISTNSTEFNLGSDSFSSIDIPPGTIDTPDAAYSAASPEAPTADTSDAGYSATSPETSTAGTDTATADPEAAAQQAHADAAKDAQTSADEFTAQGDYAAAAQARETAENEASAAGDNSMLGASDSGDLANAANQQENADAYREQQAEHIASGDYEAAKEDAQNAAAATGDADYQAGGADHTGQSDKDAGNLDWAAWDQKNADSADKDAEYYAAQGDFDHAETAAEHADSYNAAAGDYAGHADPTSGAQDYDPSSVVESGGTYDAAAVDTGFDAGAGADAGAAATYDPPADDV